MVVQLIHAQLVRNPVAKLEGISIETCDNRTLIMSDGQYSAYCAGFGLIRSIRPVNLMKVRFIG